MHKKILIMVALVLLAVLVVLFINKNKETRTVVNPIDNTDNALVDNSNGNTNDGSDDSNGGRSDNASGDFDANALIGLTEDEAAVLAAENGVAFRVGAREGEFLAVTQDLRPGRITATIDGGVVSSFTVE